jgi:hypothetical protein
MMKKLSVVNTVVCHTLTEPSRAKHHILDKLKQDETWAMFSKLDVNVFVNTMHFHSQQKRPNLKLKT